MLKEEQDRKFGKNFIERYLAHGFGSMTKTEIDILVFHLLSETDEIMGKSNYHVANFLKITESKVKSLRLNAALRYKPANHKAVLVNIITRIIEEMEKPEVKDGLVTITLENPVERREFEYAVKSCGRTIEYGLNNELLKISPIALFEIVLKNLDNAEQIFKTIVQKLISDQDKQNAIMNSAHTFQQRIKELFEEVVDKKSIIGLLLHGIS